MEIIKRLMYKNRIKCNKNIVVNYMLYKCDLCKNWKFFQKHQNLSLHLIEIINGQKHYNSWYIQKKENLCACVCVCMLYFNDKEFNESSLTFKMKVNF